MTRTIAITGAGGGIGQALARELGAEGNRLLLIDRPSSVLHRLAQELGAAAYEGAPLTLAECRAALEAAGPTIDGFVHLAGTFEADPELAEDPDIWQRTMHNNLENAYSFATAVIPLLPETGGARLVFTSSMAFRIGAVQHTAYTAAKAGLVGLTRSLARRLAGRATVNAVAPGLIETPMAKPLINRAGASLLTGNPMNRFGQPEEVSAAIRFFLSDAASYVTGQTLNVDGGQSMD